MSACLSRASGIAGDLDGADFAAPHNVVDRDDGDTDILIASKPRKHR